MFRRLKFALSYALRNMRRDRQRTAFALFSIAAGVATVVALRALGLMLTDALTANAQAFLRGDLRVETRGTEVRISFLDTAQRDPAFSAQSRAQIDAWAARYGIEVTYTMTSELMQAAVVREGRAGRPAFAMGTFIDPAVYPFYDVIRAEEPPGTPLASLFDGPDQVVVGRRLADQLGIQVGDSLRLSAAETLHTVKGIVPDAAESTFDNPMGFMFSFVYLDEAYSANFGIAPGAADRAYLKIPPELEQYEVERMIYEQWPRAGNGSRWRVLTAARELQRNVMVSDAISRFVLLLSLVGLVIGGVGIINTMFVSVNRRSTEIAVLKTLGLRGRGVSLIFLTEAFVAGVLGSLLGIVIGIGLSFIARDFGQQAFGLALPWRLHLDPMIVGMALGVAITMFFSFLPTLMAGQVRPNLVLRQGNIPLARAGCLPTLASLLVLVVGIGLLVDLILGTNRFDFPGLLPPPPLTLGIVGSFVVFSLLAAIIGLMWLLVWLLGRLPSFRNPDLRLAIRGLTMHRSRTALSLLALIIGMTSLSGTLIMSRSINILLYTSVSEPLGGNVIALPLLPVGSLVHAQLNSAEGVNGYRDVRFPSNSRLEAINGDRNWRSKLIDPDDVNTDLLAAQLSFILGVRLHGDPPRGTLIDGRFLGPEDQGKAHIVIPYSPRLEALGVRLGSQFTYQMRRTTRTFTVVGLVAPNPRSGVVPFSLSDSAVQAPIDMIETSMPFDLIIADVDPEVVNGAMAAVGSVPGVFVFDIGIFDSIISRILNQMAALPLLVAGLSLFAAAALIATTVSLATMERRRQIGILKAIGVRRWQALRQLLVENGIVGLAGGIISLLPTLLILGAVPALTEGLVNLPVPVDLILLMLALSVVITLFATLLTAWSAASEKPLNVLRYE